MLLPQSLLCYTSQLALKKRKKQKQQPKNVKKKKERKKENRIKTEKKKCKTHSQEIKKSSGPDTNTSQMILEASEMEFKITIIDIL